MRSTIRNAVEVLLRPGYAVFAFSTAVLSFVVYSLLLNVDLLTMLVGSGEYVLAGKMVPLLTAGFVKSTTILSLVLLAITSILVGVNFALAGFRLVEMSEFGVGGAGSVGSMVLATLAPACPACATAIFAFAGLSTLFAILPFQGTELKILAVFLLAGSAFYIAGQIDSEVCERCQM